MSFKSVQIGKLQTKEDAKTIKPMNLSLCDAKQKFPTWFSDLTNQSKSLKYIRWVILN